MDRSLVVAMVACLGLWQTAPAQCVNAQWQGLSDVPGVNGAVWTGVEWDPDGPGPRQPVLVVGGSFDIAGSVFSNSVAMWDGERWSTMVGCIHPPIEGEGEVRALTVFNGDLVAAGYGMAGPGGHPVEGVLRWDGAAWNPLGGLRGFTLDLLRYHGGIAATGTLSLPGDDEAARTMLWDGSQWTRLGTLTHDGQPALIIQSVILDGDLVVAGRIDSRGWSAGEWDGAPDRWWLG